MNDLTKFFAVLIVILAVYSLAVTVALIRSRNENRELIEGVNATIRKIEVMTEQVKNGTLP